MSQQDVIWFQPKVDWWVWSLLALPVLAGLGLLIAGLVEGDLIRSMIAIIYGVFLGTVYALVILPVRYGINSEELIVRHGVMRHRIRLDAIREVKPTRALWSSAALSLDRLEVRTGPAYFSMILISPKDREGFLTELSLHSGLTRDGCRLVPSFTNEVT